MTFSFDRIVFSPRDVDLARSPLAGKIGAETYILGAFNPGMTRLANGNLLLMVRVAEALRNPIHDGHIHAIRWDEGGYVRDPWPLDQVDTSDPRKFMMRSAGWKVMALTSLSWLLPVELSADGRGSYEFSVPLKTLGLVPSPGLTIKADVGILRGSAGVTIERLYWHNKGTGLTADLPGEAMLTPAMWGEWRIGAE